jgi:exoribonuclease II
VAPSHESERALLLRVARQAMLDHGLEPDFPPTALAEAGALSESAMARDGARDLRALPWCSIDNDDSRDLDQLTVADLPVGGSTTIRVAVADVSATVTHGSALDRHARANTTSVYTRARSVLRALRNRSPDASDRDRRNRHLPERSLDGSGRSQLDGC